MTPETELTTPSTSPTDAPSPPTGSATFHLFAKFPLELQMMVWECVPTIRRCFVVDHGGITATPLPDLSPKHQVILAVCKLSRKIALQRFVPAYAVKRSREFWELSLRQTPWNWEAAPKIYIDPVCDLFDITYITRGMCTPATMKLEQGAAMMVEWRLTRYLGPELPLKLIENVAVGTPEYRAEWGRFIRTRSEDFNHQHHGERYRSAIERMILPKLKTMIIVPAYDILFRRPHSGPFLTSQHYFEKMLLTTAQINEGLVFEGQVVETDFLIPHRLGDQTTVVRKVGEGTCYMEGLPVTCNGADVRYRTRN